MHTKLTSDKARIAQAFAWERSHCTTDEQIKVLDSMIERLAVTIFGNRSRIQRNEFLRFAKYGRDLNGRTFADRYASLLQGDN